MRVDTALNQARISLCCEVMAPMGYNKTFLDFFEECLTEYPYTEIES